MGMLLVSISTIVGGTPLKKLSRYSGTSGYFFTAATVAKRIRPPGHDYA
jgi:hypothetical protein